MSVFVDIGRTVQSFIAKTFYGNPSKECFVVAITGTTRKTTTGLLLHYFFEHLVGTTLLVTKDFVSMGRQRTALEKPITSPVQMQSLLADAKAAGCQIVILCLDREDVTNMIVDSLEIDIAVLTTISGFDSYDDAHTLEKEIQQYKSVFDRVLANTKTNKLAIFPKDDKRGVQRQEIMSFDKVLNYGIMGSAAVQGQATASGDLAYSYLGQTQIISSPFVSSQNIYACLAAMSVCLLMGVQNETLIQLLPSIPMDLIENVTTIQKNGIDFVFTTMMSHDGISHILDEYSSRTGHGSVIFLYTLPDGVKEFPYDVQKIYSRLQKHNNILIVSTPYMEYAYPDNYVLQEGINFYQFFGIKVALHFAKAIAGPGDTVIVTTHKQRMQQDIDAIQNLT